jgi:hypothetical protein
MRTGGPRLIPASRSDDYPRVTVDAAGGATADFAGA